ncbi:MAG: hypothetical protein JXO48_11590 [Deltaproteobacteria bacterium]|nr:hypothetical protein [Deltaproteobacteria bacterium]
MRKNYIQYLLLLVLVLILPLLFSCGDTDSEEGETASITLTASKTTLPADGVSSAAITALLKDAAGNAVEEGTVVRFSTNLGSFPNGAQNYSMNIQSGGQVTISFIAAETPGTALIAATSEGISQAIEITLE